MSALEKRLFLIFIILCLGLVNLNLEESSAANSANMVKDTTYSHPVNHNMKLTGYYGTVGIRTINVLIYNGRNSDSDCVNGIKLCMIKANKKNLVPGYRFHYSTSPIINSARLKYYNVLVMPGGDDYINDYGKTIGTINPAAIRSFVASGHGYLGTCAGAYSGAKYTVGWYRGWGVAPHVNCKGRYHVGRLSIQISSYGRKLFGYGGILPTLHWNGPAMYASGGQIFTFATYADNIIGSKGMGAIVGDSYYNGRSVLIGPHPELYPQYPDIVAKLIAWTTR